MKRILFIVGLALLTVGASLPPSQLAVFFQEPAGGSAPSYLFQETFEAPGYENSWTDSGSPDPDYTGIVLQGSYSFRLNPSAAVQTAYHNISQSGTIYGYFLLHPVARNGASSRRIFNVSQTSGIGVAPFQIIVVNSTGALRGVHGATTFTTTSALADGTTYHVWWSYTPGTGSDGVATVAFSTDGTKPTSGNNFATTTTGTGTGTMASIYIGDPGSTTHEYIFDAVLLNTTDIPSNPVY